MAQDIYIPFDIETDPAVLHQQMIDELRALLPDWLPADAALENLLMAIDSRRHGEARELLKAVTDQIYRGWVIDVLGIPALDASYAAVQSTWTASDTAGHTIAADTQVAIADNVGGQVGFRVRDDVAILAGGQTTALGAVVLQAISPGAAGSGLTGPVTAIDSLAWLSTITLDGGITTGGRDAESETEFRDRTSRRLQLISEAPIVALDFSILATDIAGVARAATKPLYNPVDATSNNAGMFTTALVDPAGGAVSSGVRAAVAALFGKLTLTGVVANVVDATYTTINVAFTATCYQGFNPVTVQASAIAAVRALLDPAVWGMPTYGDPGTSGGWIDDLVVRPSEISAAINGVEGIHYVDTLTVNGATANVTMAGPFALPRPGTVGGTVSVG